VIFILVFLNAICLSLNVIIKLNSLSGQAFVRSNYHPLEIVFLNHNQENRPTDDMEKGNDYIAQYVSHVP